MKKLLLFALTLSSAAMLAHASNRSVNFEYQKADKRITVSGNLCTYSKRSKPQLPDAIIAHIHDYIKGHNIQFVEQIKDINSGMFGRRLNTAELALMYQLNNKHLDINYYFEGNNACASYSALIKLDFTIDDNHFFEFEQPKNWRFLAKTGDLIEINQAIKSVYPNIDIKADEINSALVVLSEVSKSYSLYQFNADQYKQLSLSKLNSVFIEAKQPYKSALIEYVSSYQYQVVSQKEEANWHVTLTPKQQTNPVKFVIHYQSNKTAKQMIENTPSVLPSLPNNNEQQLKAIVLLHLEMMEFIEYLRTE